MTGARSARRGRSGAGVGSLTGDLGAECPRLLVLNAHEHGPPTHRVPPEPAVVELPLGAAHRERVERAANAAHVLCDVLWEALHEQLGARPDSGAASNVGSAPTQHASELAERLADVAATVALLAGADGRADVSPTPALAHAARSAAPAAPTAADAPSAAVLDRRARGAGTYARPGTPTRRIAAASPAADKPTSAAVACVSVRADTGVTDAAPQRDP